MSSALSQRAWLGENRAGWASAPTCDLDGVPLYPAPTPLLAAALRVSPSVACRVLRETPPWPKGGAEDLVSANPASLPLLTPHSCFLPRDLFWFLETGPALLGGFAVVCLAS